MIFKKSPNFKFTAILFVLAFTSTSLFAQLFESSYPDGESAKPSKKLIFYSMLIPGLGEYMMGEKDYLKYFLTTEITLIIGGYSLDYYSTSVMNDAINYAKQRGEISGDLTDRQFLIAVGNFNSLSEYNVATAQKRNLREIYKEDEIHHWQWKSKEDRYIFEERRQHSELVSQAIPFVVGAIIINHAVSAFNVLRLMKNYNRTQSETTSSILDNSKLWATPADQINRFGKGIQINYQFTF